MKYSIQMPRPHDVDVLLHILAQTHVISPAPELDEIVIHCPVDIEDPEAWATLNADRFQKHGIEATARRKAE